MRLAVYGSWIYLKSGIERSLVELFRRSRHEWTLYTQASPSASGGRGLATGRMFAADGTLVASVAQEGMLRVKES